MKRRAVLPATERPNPRAARLDRLSARQILILMNREDARVAAAVRRSVPQIARAVEAIVASLRRGGRLIYVGAGSSGRLGGVDAPGGPPPVGGPPPHGAGRGPVKPGRTRVRLFGGG